MKERLAKAINSLLENDPYNSLLLRQRQLMYNTSICTIDSFCGSVVREYFHILGVQKDFRLADENEIKVIGSEGLKAYSKIFTEKIPLILRRLLMLLQIKTVTII